MEIRWLQDFLAVAETGNFTRAAAMRNTSQAAFSRLIQQLESWFGVALIDRSILPTQLWPEGAPEPAPVPLFHAKYGPTQRQTATDSY